ncbi:GIY-YIG nuclease family protein [uncultured Brevundimonas sp.]|uniref:GIY-YIG nuclease family protein n=1 Tax=uncultured Brevundimonas sp. TaxID=213418 RepID=UPI0030EBC173|tara:strand:- start:91253 stop:91588 length:336 start_codon:yes stop_codon:yes gene_type:complete
MGRERVLIAVYILTNGPYGTLYAGVTSNLYQRVQQHRDGTFPGFTSENGLKRLVWFEIFASMTDAIQREKSLKRYLRDWKINLIERNNPHWDDLSLQRDRPPVWKHGPTDE